MLAYSFKFSGMTQVLPGRQSKSHTARESWPLGWQALSTFATTRSYYLTATFGGHTFAKPEFTGSTKFWWSKCRLHCIVKKGVIR